MKACFSTWCTDDYIDRVGLEKQQASLAYFHPDIPRYVFNSRDTDMSMKKYNWPDIKMYMMPVQPIERQLYDEYDLVIHIDGDCTVTGPLDELLEGDFDIAGVRNNSDHGTAGCTPAITIYDPYNQSHIPWERFCNAGLTASTKKQFWHDWFKANKRHGSNHPGHEQDILNCIINSNKYKFKLLDPIGSNVSYGVSNIWGPVEDYNRGIYNHWESWKNIYLKDDKLYINTLTDRRPLQIKILHVAGGYNSPANKLNYQQYGFKDDVLDRLKEIASSE